MMLIPGKKKLSLAHKDVATDMMNVLSQAWMLKFFIVAGDSLQKELVNREEKERT